MRKITHIVHHYSATYPDQDIGAAEIDLMHRARGFSSIGYHYVIRRDGTIERGRPESQVGAHVKGHNANSIGICCIGGLDRRTGPNVGVDNRTPAQKAAAARLTRELLGRHPNARVVGHRDLGPTQCPAFDVAKWWAEVSAPPSVIDAVPPPPVPQVVKPARRIRPADQAAVAVIVAAVVAALFFVFS